MDSFNNIRRILGMAMLFFLVICYACSQTSVDRRYTQLYEMFKATARFGQVYPREKVYVHFDNTSYIVGDTIWYKAYVVRASSLHPSDLSKVLYVELLNAEGEQMEKQILKINERGSACGCIALKRPVLAGYYEVRAYTREMLNWGENNCFSRVIPVFYKDETDIKHKKGVDWEPIRLSIPFVSKPGRKESVPRPYEMKFPEDRLLSFYPEGGQVAKGMVQRVAFKLTNGRGTPVSDSVFVYRNNGDFITYAVPEYEGMGTFDLPEDFEGGYACLNRVKTGLMNKDLQKYAIPTPSSIYSLRVDMTESMLSVKIAGDRSVITNKQLLGIGIFNKDKAIYFDTLTIDSPLNLIIPIEKLHGGVNRLDLFDSQKGCIASRIFWAPLNMDDSVRIARTKAMVGKKTNEKESSTVLKINVVDCQGKPIQGADLSVSVTKDDILSNHNIGIGEHLLLASDLRGYIHRPDLYIERNDAPHRRMLDLLMMVQGWSANSFDVMSGRVSFEALHPIEKKLMVSGVVCKSDDLKKPYGHVSLMIDNYQIHKDSVVDISSSLQVNTDEKGRFAVDMDKKEGEWLMNYSPKNAESDLDWSRIAISQWYEPSPKPYFEPEMELLPTSNRITGETSKKQKMSDLYILNRGNKYGIVRNLKYYDILRFRERLMDNGFKSSISLLKAMHLLDGNSLFDLGLYTPQTILEYIRNMNAPNQENLTSFQNFRIQQESKKYKSGYKRRILYKGTLVKVYIDDTLAEYVPDLDSLDIGEIRSVALIQTIEPEKVSNSQRPKYSLYMYTIKSSKKKSSAMQGQVESRYALGYTPQRKFYSPDYRNFVLMPELQKRRTLYWNSDVQTDSNGDAFVVPLPHSNNAESWHVSVRGISADGVFIDYDNGK